MGLEQINHLERLVKSKDRELKEVKGKLNHCGNLSKKRLNQIEELQKENEAYKLSFMFLEDQLLDAKNNYMSIEAENALLKQQLKRKGEH